MSPVTHPDVPALDAPPPDAESPDQRKARQFADLRRLAALGMDLATRAHARAAEQLDAPPAPDAPRPPVDYPVTFAILSRAVRQVIAVETRLDNARPRPSFRPVTATPDPRRLVLREVFYDAVAQERDRGARHREIDRCIDVQLDADPHAEVPLGHIADALGQALGITLDPRRVPDELLDRGPGTGVRNYRPHPAFANPPPRPRRVPAPNGPPKAPAQSSPPQSAPAQSSPPQS